REERYQGQLLGRREVGGEDRSRAPGHGQLPVAVEPPAEELEVVGDDHEPTDGDEDEEPGRPRDRGDHTDGDRACERADRERPEHTRRDLRVQRPAVQLVEGMRRYTEPEEERDRKSTRLN